MKRAIRLSTILSVIPVLLAAAFSIDAQVYDGRAIGIRATSTINGNTSTVVSADTGSLPITGGNISITVPTSLVPGSTSTGVIASNTSGILKTSQAASIVNDFDFNISGLRIRANRVVANATCFCCPGSAEANCVGGVQITGLTVTDAAGATTNVAVTGQANQLVTLPNGSGTLTINEQTNGFETISVNGLHIVAASGVNTYDVRVASISTSISCAVVLPTPAHVSVSGRALSPSGGAVIGATVTLSDMAGNTRNTTTNSFGAFNFADVEVGHSYTIVVSKKGYSFDPLVITLSDELAVEIRATGLR
jgi:hypothetical protein